MSCIINRESRGNPAVHNWNPATRDDSWGVLQVNLYGNLLPGRLAILQSMGYAVYDAASAGAVLTDPIVNLRVALVLSGGGYNLSPWGGGC